MFLLNCSLFLFSQTDEVATRVHFIDVGQGDCIFIDSGDYEILIDGGNNHYGEYVSDYISPYIHGTLELIVATHPDADHIGGLDTVLKRFSVGTVIDSGKKHTTKTYNDYINAVLNEIGVVFLNDFDMAIAISDNIVFNIIEVVDDRDDNNQNSVISTLDVNGIKFLFTGDLESDLEIEYIDKFPTSHVLKVGHHGSRTSTSLEFVNKVNPKYAIISCEKNNRYGHPHSQVLDILNKKNINILRTDVLGTIIAEVKDSEVIFQYVSTE